MALRKAASTELRPGRAPAVPTAVGIPASAGFVAVKPKIPPAIVKRIADAVQSSRSEGPARPTRPRGDASPVGARLSVCAQPVE